VTENTLLLLDRGFYHFNFWLKLIDKKKGGSNQSGTMAMAGMPKQ